MFGRMCRFACAGTLVLLAVLTSARAEDRALRGVALVIGQSAYEQLGPLSNTANDARALDRLLSDLGFDVDAVIDGSRQRIERALRRFSEDAADADVALLYYAGHGIEAGGENFLVPVNARLPSTGSAADLIALSRLVEELRRTVPVTIVLLDACRDNPYPPGTKIGAGAEARPIADTGLGILRGASSLRNDGGESLGTVIGFAAEPGRAALDGAPGSNSPYAAALIKHLPASGFAFGDVMTLVAEEVYLKTAGRQLPWINASLRRLLFFGVETEPKGGDEQAIRSGRRSLLLQIAAVPPDKRALVERVAASNGVPLDALYGMLGILGIDTSQGDLEQLLSKGAERLRDMRAARDAQTLEDAEIVRLAGLAERAEEEGAIGLALEFRAKASSRADALDRTLDQAELDIAARRRELAATYRRHAETASLNFDFAVAAQRFGDAYSQVEQLDHALAYEMKVLEANALADLGLYGGDNRALLRSVAAYEAAAGLGRSERNSGRDAALLTNAAVVMTQIFGRSGDVAWLTKAEANYERALAMQTDRRDRAATLLNLGSLFEVRADRGGGPADLHRALEAYSEASAVFTRENDAEQWAGLQMNIGGVHARLGSWGGGAGEFRTAVAAIEQALEIWTHSAHPVNWALAQSNLGSALHALGAAKRDASLVRRGIAAIEASQEIATRERQPMSWAGDMNNLGSAYLTLAELDREPAFYGRAVNAYRAARTVFAAAGDGQSTLSTFYNEGRALMLRGREGQDPAILREALEVLDATITTIAPHGNPIARARFRSVSGEALFALGSIERDKSILRRARAAFDDARRTYRDSGMGETGQAFWAKQIAAIDAELKR